MNFQVYARGLCYISVCVNIGTTREEIEREANEQEPTGIESQWSISENSHFNSGQTNPCPCTIDPDKEHYLMSC